MFRPAKAHFLTLLLTVMPACRPQEGLAEPKHLSTRTIQVVVSSKILADIVRHVGGARVAIVDCEQHSARRGKANRTAQADISLYNSLNWRDSHDEAVQYARTGVHMVSIADCFDSERDLLPLPRESIHEGFDPHVWFDVSLAMKAATFVRDLLIRIDSAHEEVYRYNTNNYLAELRRLHVHLKQQASRIPKARRVLLTSHTTFAYFARAYSFELRVLPDMETATQEGAPDLHSLAEFIVNRKIPAPFLDAAMSPKVITTLQGAVKAKGIELQVGGNLREDPLDGSYERMMRHNMDTIVTAFAGS